MKIKFINIWLMLWDQMPPKRFWRNLIHGHIRRKFNKRSHFRENGDAKVIYNTQLSAMKAAMAMNERALKRDENKTYIYYKCVFCDGYHIGGNVMNKIST